MGRTNGKLQNFLKEALIKKTYINLHRINPMSTEFVLDLPRYEKEMENKYQAVVKDWSDINKRVYVNYSNGKAVLKAAMKKSVYLMYLGKHGNGLKFRFSSTKEIEEKRKHQRGNQAGHYINVSEDEMPPSVASSGYSSGHDTFDNSPETFVVHDQQDNSDIDTAVDTVLPDIEDNDLLKDVFMMTKNDPPDMKIEADEYFKDANLNDLGSGLELDKWESSKISLGDLNDFYKDILLEYSSVVPYDVPSEQESLTVNPPLHTADQGSANVGSNSGKSNNPALELFEENMMGGTNDILDLSELPNKSGNIASDQTLCGGLNQPLSVMETSQMLASSLIPVPEKKFWMCVNKLKVGSIIQYICEPMNLASLEVSSAGAVYNIVSINENAESTSTVFIGSTHWEPDRTMVLYMVSSDGKYLLVFYE